MGQCYNNVCPETNFAARVNLKSDIITFPDLRSRQMGKAAKAVVELKHLLKQ